MAMAGKMHVCCSHAVGMMTDQENMSQEDRRIRIAKNILSGVDILN